ncbi:MAG: hypothetical protein QOD75_32 [Blastocatellia bacterium]|jgi:hypothetical protein|nr:hypothetical protein [Blastocatellia bacterium]
MKKLKRMMAGMMMGAILSAGAFAQKPKDEPKRPPKDPDNKVVVKDKQPAPNSNTNQGNRGERKP